MRRRIADVLRIALRSLRRNRRRSALTLAAVIIGVTVVVFAFGFGEGLTTSLVRTLVDARIGALQVHAIGYLDAVEAQPLKKDFALDDELLAKVKGTPGVASVAPRLRFGALLGDGATATIVMVDAVDPRNELLVCPARKQEVPANHGAFVDDAQPHGGVLGAELASGLKSKLGATLTLQAAGKEGQLNALDLEVRGISRGAASFLESKRSVTVPLAYGQELLQMQGRATELALQLDDVRRVDEVKAALQARLGPGFEVSTWAEVMPFLRDATSRVQIILRGVSVVLFFLVVFSVVNTMLMNVYERVREIGTLLAIGWKRRTILALFVLEAAVLGLLGGAIGASLGLLLTRFTYEVGIPLTPPGAGFEQIIRPVPDVNIALLAFAAAALGAVLAALGPAKRASDLNPVDALRST
ncbi:MAG: ABC transporter permease [Deltaproteobacteria bacterium]|nr:ABC transporter permease [Deltaproteobacteria bacterium]